MTEKGWNLRSRIIINNLLWKMVAVEIAWKHFLKQEKAVCVKFQSSKDEHFYRKMDANFVDVQAVIGLIRWEKKKMMINQKIKMKVLEITPENIKWMILTKITLILMRKELSVWGKMEKVGNMMNGIAQKKILKFYCRVLLA
jgi:hypothetical protein